MNNNYLLGIGIFFWLYGLILGSLAGGEEIIKVPRWISIILFSFRQEVPVPRFVFEVWGLLMIFYAITIGRFTSSALIHLVVGILGTLFITTKVILNRLR